MARRTATRALQGPVGPQNVTLPAHWSHRSYQLDLMRSMPANAVVRPDMTKYRFVLPWHRRSGKDLTAVAMIAREMNHRVGLYAHIFPNLNQARKIVWDGKDNQGIAFLDRFPQAIILEKNETELQIVFKPLPGQPGFGDPKAKGSTYQLFGANDHPDSLRGLNYIGVVFSEYAETDPYAWDVVQPAIEASKGWAMFNFTPKGRNHAFKLYEMAKQNPRWFVQLLTIDDTREDAEGESGKPIMTHDEIEELRRQGVNEDKIQQEYFCSFTGFLHGTIFGDLVNAARNEKRIGNFPWSSGLPVGILADIGRTDSTALWFYQRIGQQIIFIDYYENSLKGADFYAKVISEKPYLISRFILPHDARVKGFTAAESPERYFSRIFRGVQVAPKLALQTGIDMTRRMFSRCYFDASKCAAGLDHLENYRRKWNNELHDYSGDPIHDEHSHGADAFRMGAQGGADEPLEFLDNYNDGGGPSVQECDFQIFDEPRQMIQ